MMVLVAWDVRSQGLGLSAALSHSESADTFRTGGLQPEAGCSSGSVFSSSLCHWNSVSQSVFWWLSKLQRLPEGSVKGMSSLPSTKLSACLLLMSETSWSDLEQRLDFDGVCVTCVWAHPVIQQCKTQHHLAVTNTQQHSGESRSCASLSWRGSSPDARKKWGSSWRP